MKSISSRKEHSVYMLERASDADSIISYYSVIRLT